MADKYTKKAVESSPAPDWKQVQVEKEHQPAKQKSMVTYANLEQQKAHQVAQKASCDERIAELEDQMSKVEAAAKAE